MASPLCFNIIYTPGTFRFLWPAASSLIESSPYRFRLVANGLGEAEARALVDACRDHPRPEALIYPTERLASHGAVLNHLLEREQGERFCFLDSDIFCVAPFVEGLEAELESCDVFSSCQALLWPDDEVRKGFLGQSSHTPGGQRLPTSFFCVLPAERTRRLIADCGISLDRYRKPEQIPERAAAVARELGWDGAQMFDTLKLAACLLIHDGCRVRHQELDGLLHLGGFSSWLRGASNGNFPEPVDDHYVLDATELDGDPPPDHWIRRNRIWRENRRRDDTTSWRVQQRLAAARYMTLRVLSFYGLAPEPENRLESSHALWDRVRRADEALTRIYARVRSHSEQSGDRMRT